MKKTKTQAVRTISKSKSEHRRTKEKFEDAKRVIRSLKSRRDRQCNGQKKKNKNTTTNDDLQNTTLQLL